MLRIQLQIILTIHLDIRTFTDRMANHEFCRLQADGFTDGDDP